MPNIKRVYVIMGVSGTGKSTIGKLLSKTLQIPFFDGDDFHPEANIKKMKAGNPLNDDDRKGWLIRLNELAKEHKSQGAIIACSALKKSYRDILLEDMKGSLEFIYLKGSFELIKSRLESRKGHFMPLKLLKSQFDTLEAPEKAITVPISLTPDLIVQEITNQLQ
ncbi:gluconate kinase [Flagellimonas aquimarina]|jgi:gluconokinase|uniref:Gluconokinase n=1 Tax=Flagellimonas aquimarina TaxID=2201895 RepID=A0A316KYG0_9FLAO|nr:gluconokinase [Allomuricauda koreensis]PWL38646.1 gluconate kinase [Allomuricauda koreensis]